MFAEVGAGYETTGLLAQCVLRQQVLLFDS